MPDPAFEICERAGAECTLACEILGRATAKFAAIFLEWNVFIERREKPEIHVHWLERGGAGIDRLDMPAGDMCQQRAVRGCWRRGRKRLAVALGGGKARGKETNGGGFNITLAAGDLSGKTPARICFQPQAFVK